MPIFEAFKPEQFSEPLHRLVEHGRIPSAKADRPTSLSLNFLKAKADVQEFDLAADAVDALSDPDNKSAFSALLTMLA